MTLNINFNGRFDVSGPEGLRNLAGGNAPGGHHKNHTHPGGVPEPMT